LLAIIAIDVRHLLRSSCHFAFANFIGLMRQSQNDSLKLKFETICSVQCWKLQEVAALQLIQLTLTFMGICTALWNSEISESASSELGGKVAIGTFSFCLLKSSVDMLRQSS
jgi:hypothetical protein